MSNAESTDVDPRLEAIVERMLNKYVGLSLILACIFLGVLWMCLSSMSLSFEHASLILAVSTFLPVGSSPYVFLGVSRMGNTNKLWELQLSAEDWTN